MKPDFKICFVWYWIRHSWSVLQTLTMKKISFDENYNLQLRNKNEKTRERNNVIAKVVLNLLRDSFKASFL